MDAAVHPRRDQVEGAAAAVGLHEVGAAEAAVAEVEVEVKAAARIRD